MKLGILIFIVLLAFFLLTYRLSELMPFIGDQGWFYISARDMAVYGDIPLVGIASSHPWLHQGPLWTYFLASVLWLFHFHPLAPGYAGVLLGIATIILLYKAVSDMFSSRIALIAALLYTTSPLIITHARMPYHTTPIPFFAILFLYALWKMVKGHGIWLPVSIVCLVVLYNLELATIPFFFILLLVLSYGWWKKKKWLVSLRHKKIILLSCAAFIIPMFPILLYDTQHGFPQTLKFAAWMGYKILVIFGYPPLHPEIVPPSWQTVMGFAAAAYQRLIFVESGLVAFTLFLFTFGLFYKNLISQFRSKVYRSQYMLLCLVVTIPLLAYFAARTPSEAYLPMLFPSVIIVTALWFDRFMQRRLQYVLTLVILLLMSFMNVYMIVNNNYFISHLGYSFSERFAAAKQIVSEADGRRYNLVGKGEGSKFESFTMNYQYLAWWLGNEPVKEPQPLQIILFEEDTGIYVIKQERN